MFILITFLVLHGCVGAKYYEIKNHFRSQNRVIGPGIDLKTLKHLAKAFPNHAIEIHVQGTHDDAPEMKNKHRVMKNTRFRGDRNIHQKWPYRIIGRSGENPKLDNASLANAGASKKLLFTSPTNTMTTKLETMPTTAMRELFRHKPADPKQPLYMQDLIQALEDFEKKLTTKMDNNYYGSSSTSDYANLPVVKKDLWDLEKILCCSVADKDSAFGSNEQPTLAHIDNRNMGVKNFHDVLRLMKKGVKVQLEVTTPRHQNQNVKWVPIKVPKDTYH